MNKHTKKILVNCIVALFLIAAAAWFASLFIHIGGVYTDNAQVRQDIIPVISRVQGYAKDIRFSEFQQVKKGDTLVIVEDAEYRLRLAQAQADLENAQAGEHAADAGIATTEGAILTSEAAIEEVRIQLKNAENEYRRYEKLLTKEAVTQQQFDAVETQYYGLKAKLSTMEQQKATSQLARNEQTFRQRQSQAHIELCRAALELAQLNLSYTVILASCDGVTSAKWIQEGEVLMPGQKLLSIVSDEEAWIIANFRESQMKSIALGKEVKIAVDALTKERFRGKVTAIADATGAQYSPMAPDNAQGNFVKIEQRIPVKISITEGPVEKLSSGMNVRCKVLK